MSISISRSSDADRAYANVFAKSAGFARFKQKGQSDRLRYRPGVKLDQANHRLFVPKLGWLRHSRDVLGVVKNVNLSPSCGKWLVSSKLSARFHQRWRMAARSASTGVWPVWPR